MNKWKIALLSFVLALAVPVSAHASVKVLIDDVEKGFANEISVSSTYGTKVGDKLTITAPAMAEGETIVNTTDDLVRIASNDSHIAMEVYSPLTSNGTAEIRITGDAAADATDSFRIKNGAAGSLLFGNDSSVAGTYVDLTTMTSAGDWIFGGTTPVLTVGDAGEEDTAVIFDGNAQDFHIGLDDSADDLIIGLGTALGTTPIISMTDVGHTTITGSTDGILTVYGAGTTASDAYLRLVGDAQADASDGWQFWNDSSAASLIIGNDSTTPGTYVTKLTIASTGVMTSAVGTVHTSGAAVALTPGATPTLTVVPGRQVFTYQPDDNTDATFNASGTGSAGDEMVFIFTTDAAGSGDEVMTFGTNMHSTGTLTMANLASDIYTVSFVSNGTKWVETARTAVQTT